VDSLYHQQMQYNPADYDSKIFETSLFSKFFVTCFVVRGWSFGKIRETMIRMLYKPITRIMHFSKQLWNHRRITLEQLLIL
jgi:hypothetical protein